MAGIYLHIPFCKQACHYCDFHFSTLLKNKSDLIQAMFREMDMRKDYLSGEKIQTIYFGGGTPSILSTDELHRFFERLYATFQITEDVEITLEANPDDLTNQKIKELRSTPVNRLSIGIQSFRDEDLTLMNRAHTASQSDYSVKAAQDKGFENITIDLIYSIPGLNMVDWKGNVEKAIALSVQHMSAYSLTIEPNTVFGRNEHKGRLKQVDQDFSSDQFFVMLDSLRRSGFEQYEVSNFCLPGFESKHNTSYWKNEKYIGLGPSAHSFDGSSRQWNVANNSRYVRGVEKGELEFEREVLDQRTQLNEYLMTGLRTRWGIDLERIKRQFSVDLENEYRDRFEEWMERGLINKNVNSWILTDKGMLMADRIASELFILEKE